VEQTPFVIIHSNRLAPRLNPVTPEVAKAGLVTVAPPLTTVHVPTPTVVVLPARAALVEQTFWSVPASAVVGDSSLVIVTVSGEDGHTPLLTVQTKEFTPTLKLVTPEVGEPGAVTEALPSITVHVPAPVVGVLPASVAVVEQTV
jgi:hypothetical protein